MKQQAKPRMVFFQWKHKDLPKYLNAHLSDHIRCLSNFFDVIVISENSDYQEVCDKYQPELVLFESGVYAVNKTNEPSRQIINTFANPKIPKIGFIHADAYCLSRESILSDFEEWGIETFFTLSVSMGEYIPEISKNLFVWPNYVDTNLFYDYGESKNIPVLFTGSQASHYPWRNKISRILTRNYPSLTCPHFGWNNEKLTSRMIYGEKYARMLNASWFVPSCGTIAKDVVRKHFEIPASKACLVAEKTMALEAAGFIDMENCLFANEADVLDKLDYLFQNQEVLISIIDKGFRLVHSNHTLEERDQIFQWFVLNKNLKSNEKIIQSSPFGQLESVNKNLDIKNSKIVSYGTDRLLLREGDKKLWLRKYDEAEELYLECLNFHNVIPEPKMRLCLCNLYKGNAKLATEWILQPIKITLEEYKASSPDPVEWAYFIISLLCEGRIDEATKNASRFETLHHPELERMRWILDILGGKTRNLVLTTNTEIKYRYSLHQMPNWNIEEWISEISMMLNACGKSNLSALLLNSTVQECQNKFQPLINSNQKEPLFPQRRENFISQSQVVKKHEKKIFISFLSRVYELNLQVKSKIKDKARTILNNLEIKIGSFLPYKFSIKRNDFFFYTIQKIAREDIRTALLVGLDTVEGCTEAFMTGILENSNNPIVLCIVNSEHKTSRFEKKYGIQDKIKIYKVNSYNEIGEINRTKIEYLFQEIGEENESDCFDLLIIDASKKLAYDLKEVCKVKFIVFQNLNCFENFKNKVHVISNSEYFLVDQDPIQHGGYAIFQRKIF